jgi:hypothetical protein
MSLLYNGFFIEKTGFGTVIRPETFNKVYTSVEEAKKAVDFIHDQEYAKNKSKFTANVSSINEAMASNHGNKTVDDVLGERGNTYGSFQQNSQVAQELKTVLQKSVDNLEPYMLEAIHQILSKISRIVCGNPHYKDNWTDIAGYAKLVENILDESK